MTMTLDQRQVSTRLVYGSVHDLQQKPPIFIHLQPELPVECGRERRRAVRTVAVAPLEKSTVVVVDE